MKVGIIDQSQWQMFEPLLLPLVREALERRVSVAVLGLTQDDVACGAAAYYMDEKRMQIISFYVSPEYRGLGGGSLLLITLARLARNAAAPAYEMALDFSVTTEEHSELICFLEHMGYQRRQLHDGNFYYMTLGQMLSSPYNKPEKVPAKDVVSFRQLSNVQLHMLQHHAAQSGLSVLPVSQLTDPSVEQDISCALMRDGNAIAFLLFQNDGSKLELSCAWDGAHQAQHIPKMLRYAVRQLSQKYPPETQVVVFAVNGACENLVLKLVPDAAPVFVSYYRFLN